MEKLQWLGDLLATHGIKILLGFLAGAVGMWLGRLRAQARWRKREFRDRLNVSLNYIDDGCLKIRTVLEDKLDEVMLSSVAAELVTKAATETKPGKPILPLPAGERWFVHNEVLNQIAEHFSGGLLRKEMGQAVQTARYLLVLTCEAEGEVRTRKLRAMLLRESLAANYRRQYGDQPPRFEVGHHKTRHKTLLAIADAYAKQPDGFTVIELHA